MNLNTSSTPNTHSFEYLRTSIYQEMEKFAELLCLYDIDVKIDSRLAIEAWNQRSVEEKSKIVENFSRARRIYSEMHLAGVSLRDNKAMLSRSLARCGLVARHNLVESINDNTMVEIYNLEAVQLYRSINFFDYCNYSLLDLLAREWFVLYDRLPSITDAILKDAHEAIITGRMFPYNVPPHIMKEIDSDPRGIFHIEHHLCCPLYSEQGEAVAVVSSMHVREIDVMAANDERLVFLPRVSHNNDNQLS